MIVSNMQNRISCLRKQCSLSQKQFAEILRISQSSLSKYEKDRLAIPSVVLIQMSEYFKVSVDIVNIALHISLKNFEQQCNGINIHAA